MTLYTYKITHYPRIVKPFADLSENFSTPRCLLEKNYQTVFADKKHNRFVHEGSYCCKGLLEEGGEKTADVFWIFLKNSKKVLDISENT